MAQTLRVNVDVTMSQLCQADLFLSSLIGWRYPSFKLKGDTKTSNIMWLKSFTADYCPQCNRSEWFTPKCCRASDGIALVTGLNSPETQDPFWYHQTQCCEWLQQSVAPNHREGDKYQKVLGDQVLLWFVVKSLLSAIHIGRFSVRNSPRWVGGFAFATRSFLTSAAFSQSSTVHAFWWHLAAVRWSIGWKQQTTESWYWTASGVHTYTTVMSHSPQQLQNISDM